MKYDMCLESTLISSMVTNPIMTWKQISIVKGVSVRVRLGYLISLGVVFLIYKELIVIGNLFSMHEVFVMQIILGCLNARAVNISKCNVLTGRSRRCRSKDSRQGKKDREREWPSRETNLHTL